MESLGKDQYARYCKQMVTDRTHSIHDPIKKNALPLFSCPHPKAKTRQAGKISLLKNDVALFSRLYIVMQQRSSDMTTYFSHENHPFPPSLSDCGKLRFGKKSDLLEILTKDIQNDRPNCIDVKLLDGAAVVHMLPTSNVMTFDEYADVVFVPHIMKKLENSRRVDVVWSHISPAASRNLQERKEERGLGGRLQVRTSSQETGQASYGTRPTSRNCLHSSLTEFLPWIAQNTKKSLLHLVPQLFLEEAIDQWNYVIMKRRIPDC